MINALLFFYCILNTLKMVNKERDEIQMYMDTTNQEEVGQLNLNETIILPYFRFKSSGLFEKTMNLNLTELRMYMMPMFTVVDYDATREEETGNGWFNLFLGARFCTLEDFRGNQDLYDKAL